jgi:ribosomal protein L7/L12
MTVSEYWLAFLLVGSVIAAFFSHVRRLQDVERKLDLVLAHFGIDPTAVVPPSSHVVSLAKDPRQRIAAIRAYRQQTGAGLKAAAAVIEKIAAEAKGIGT